MADLNSPTPPGQPQPQPQSDQPTQDSQQPQTGGEDKEVVIGKYKIKVIRDKCISAASCVAIAANTFKLDSENKAVIQEGSSDDSDTILMAAQSCPTKAIIVIDNETGKQIWPE